MADEKRTKIGPTGPVRVVAGANAAVAANAVTATPTPAPLTSGPPATGTPAPSTESPAGHATSFLPPKTDPLLGQTLAGRYVISKKLGEGGMGAVYLATHNLLEKQVALKVLHGEFARKPDLVERFMQEAKSASRIRHENVIDVSDFGSTPEGLVFFAMELLKGHDLHEEIARARLAGQLLPWERSKKIFLQICAALQAAHALGIVHRDLKPENIYLVEFLGEPDFVKLLDFGIAKQTEVAEGDRKLTRTGMLFGTPEYMSPEQARGDTVDARVDVYAMGCILFQLVTGRVPFEAENFMGVLSLHLTEPPPVIPPEIFDSIGAPRALAAVIDHALVKDRNQRISSIEELARAVRQASGDKLTGPVVVQASVPAPASTAALGRVKTQWTGNLSIPEHDASAPPRRSKLPLILGAVIVAGGAAGAVAWFATRGGGAPGTSTGNASGAAQASGAGPASTGPIAGTPPTTSPTPPPAPPPAPPPPPTEPPLTFEWSNLRIDSQPHGAEVIDLATGKAIGRTPHPLKLKPSHIALKFELRAKGYLDTVVTLTPDQPKTEIVETLVRGTGHKPIPAAPRPDPAHPGTAPVPTTPIPTSPIPTTPIPTAPDPAKPDPASAKPDPASAKPDPVKPAPKPPEDDGIDPVLKADPSRSGSGHGSAP